MINEGLQYNRILQLLTGIHPNEDFSDCPIWRWNKNGLLPVVSAYNHFIDGGCKSLHARLSGPQKCPLKVRVFMWLISKNSFLT